MRHKPVVKLSRALGIPLTEKAGKYLERRPYPPGQNGGNRRRNNPSPYKERLVEKQRLRFQYHISEKQLRRYFDKASRGNERTGDALIQLLESRLDAVILRAGFAKTVYQARQFVSHGHVQVNGKRIDRPAYSVAIGEEVSISPKSSQMVPFEAVRTIESQGTTPLYLDVERTSLKVKMIRLPNREEVPIICNEQLVVEYYAR